MYDGRMPKIEIASIHATDNSNFIAVLKDGSLVRLLAKGTNNYEVFEITLDDKRPRGKSLAEAFGSDEIKPPKG